MIMTEAPLASLASGWDNGSPTASQDISMTEPASNPISNGISEFTQVDKEYHRMVHDLLSEGMTTGVADADAAIIAHARTHSGRGTDEPMEIGGVVTRDPRSLTARARLLQDFDADATFDGPAAMILRIESDRRVMLEGAKGMGFAHGGGTVDDRIQSKGEYHRLPESTRASIAETMSNASNVPDDIRASMTAAAAKTATDLSASSLDHDRRRSVYQDIGAPIPEKKPSLLDQAAGPAGETDMTLSQQIGTKVMAWGRENRAFKHLVSFNVLDEAIKGAMGDKTQRVELGTAEVKNIQEAVRTWAKPHVYEDIPTDGLDSAVAKAAERYAPSDILASPAKGPAEIGAPVSQRSGVER